MKMMRIYMMLLSLTVSLMVSAQGMTYNHDEVVMNQFMKAEIGSGTLGNGGWFADQYYNLTHSSYRSMANNPANNKLASRTLTNVEVTKEEKYAETIKDSLEKRAEIEALNIADRQVDVEWLVEKNKIQRQQNSITWFRRAWIQPMTPICPTLSVRPSMSCSIRICASIM